MTRRLLAIFFILLAAGAISALGARETYTGKWFGFITDSNDLNKGHNVTAEAVRASVAKGAKYVLVNAMFAGRIELAPADKIAPFAAQQVFVYGSITTDSLTKGNNAVANSVGPGGAYTINVTSITPHAQDGIY